jgi:hypothetical protein
MFFPLELHTKLRKNLEKKLYIANGGFLKYENHRLVSFPFEI